MIEGTSFRDQMICMIALFSEMEILQVEIDGETQFNTILKTLSDFFRWFMPNHTMNKSMMSLLELMGEL